MRNVWEALSDPTRREILRLLSKTDLSAGQIFTHFDITKPSLSHHLAVLKQANLVSYTKQGQSIIYSLETSGLGELVEFVKSLKK